MAVEVDGHRVGILPLVQPCHQRVLAGRDLPVNLTRVVSLSIGAEPKEVAATPLCLAHQIALRLRPFANRRKLRSDGREDEQLMTGEHRQRLLKKAERKAGCQVVSIEPVDAAAREPIRSHRYRTCARSNADRKRPRTPRIALRLSLLRAPRRLRRKPQRPPSASATHPLLVLHHNQTIRGQEGLPVCQCVGERALRASIEVTRTEPGHLHLLQDPLAQDAAHDDEPQHHAQQQKEQVVARVHRAEPHHDRHAHKPLPLAGKGEFARRAHQFAKASGHGSTLLPETAARAALRCATPAPQ